MAQKKSDIQKPCMTRLQWATLSIIKTQPYYYDHKLVDYKFTQDERKAALRLEKKKWLARTDKTGNYFELTARGKRMLAKANAYGVKLK